MLELDETVENRKICSVTFYSNILVVVGDDGIVVYHLWIIK